MQRVTYTNSRGESVVFSHQPPYVLSSIEGLGDVDADVQLQKSPYQDGSSHTDTLLEPRYLSLMITIQGNNAREVSEYREKLGRVFNPKFPGTFIYSDGFKTRKIHAISEHVPKFPSGDSRILRSLQMASINLICPDPYWRDVNPTNIKLEDYVSNFSFPFHFPVSFAIRGDVGTLKNLGDAPAPIKITFNGEAVNPQITKVNTGETIRIRRTIPTGYSLVITTGMTTTSANIIAPDGVVTDAMGYLDLSLNWSFFNLDIGDNQITFITDGGQPDVFIEYYNLYINV